MLSIVVTTHDSERALVPTLAALVPGATAGIVREVIVADGGSRDDTEQVADIAGCRFVSLAEPLGPRLKTAAGMARAPWLMFLPAGLVPAAGWVDEVAAFMEESGPARAAMFASAKSDFLTRARRLFGFAPPDDQGLIIPKSFYDELDGHPAAAPPHAALLRRIGRRKLTTLQTPAALRYLT